MPGFAPEFVITPKIAGALMRIEAAREAVIHLPITASVLASLRETAKLHSTHYSKNVKERAQEAADQGAGDDTPLLRKLDPRQRKTLELFRKSDAITSRLVAGLFTISPRTARNLLADWAKQRFVIVLNPAKKSRKYGLAREYRSLVQ
jgi:hypothetical protein